MASVGITFNEPAGDNSAGANSLFDSAPVGESVVFGNVLYQKVSDSEWYLADANFASKMPGLRMALESKTDGQTCLMLRMGRVRDDDWNWSEGPIYVSGTAGGLTQTPPSGSGDQVQIAGVAYHADKMFFDPSLVVAEVV